MMNCNFILSFFYIITVCSGFLNLYLNLEEVRKLLGLEAELYYIRDGEINHYALDFVVVIPSKIDTMQFTWQSLGLSSLPYSVEVEIPTRSLLSSKLNISADGFISATAQTWSIYLQCLGSTPMELDFNILVNITVMNDNVTSAVIRRRKICSKLEDVNNQVLINSISKANAISIFYLAICSSMIIILFLAVLIAAYYVKNSKSRTNAEIDNMPCTTFLTSIPRTTTGISYGSFRRMPSYSLINNRSKDLQERIAELTIQRCRVCLNSLIMEGTFGRVYKGTYTNEDSKEEWVIIKTVSDHASQIQISLLLQEGMSMYSLGHKNIMSIIRVSIDDHSAPFLLYPCNNISCNMKIFLQKCRLSPEGVSHTLTTQEVVEMALQVIEAMQYLHKKLILHKDLAARNCVVDESSLIVQVADNALSRDLFPSDYHCLGDNENRPIKWLAVESLVQKKFSPSSDVWSFGVLLWELTTLAQQPYLEIDPFEMEPYLKDGYRLAQPINCPDELFAVMAYCWAMSAEERPTFSQLQICLQEFYTQLIRYV